MVLGQLTECLVDPRADLFVEQGPAGVAPEELGQQRVIAGRGALLEVLLVQLDGLGPAVLAQMVDCQVHHDPIQPGVEAGVSFELV